MVATTLNGVLLTGDHASRPTATTVAKGALYACSTHALVYQSDASSWSTWATLSAGGVSLTTRGDLLTRDASALTRLAIGSADQVLKTDGTDPSWGKVLPANLDVSADNTTANATSGHHGLLPKLSGSSSDVLKGDGTWGAGGGGGGGNTYVGYNTIGASFDTPGINSKIYLKQFTLASDARLHTIGAYVDPNSGTAFGPAVAVYTDNGGSPDYPIAYNGAAGVLRRTSSLARWIDVPIGVWLVAGTYWMAVRTSDTGGTAVLKIAYDASGSDIHTTGGDAAVFPDNLNTPTNSTRKYSIRGSIG